MKLKYIVLLLSFQFAFSAETASITGKITNATENEIILNGLNFKITIPINSDGTFSKDLEIKYNGLYTFNNDSSKWDLYLTTDSNLQLNFDQNNRDETIAFSGNTSNECLYLYEKHKLYDAKNLDLTKTYSLAESDFVSCIDKVVSTNLELLKNTKDLNDFFRKSEEKNIVYNTQSNYYNYKYMHSYYTKSNVPKAKICESRLFNRDTITFNFDEFLFSTVFRGYENGRFTTSFNPKFNKNKSDAKEILSEELAKINNSVIEDFILKNLAGQLNSYDDKNNHLLKAIIDLTKDENFKTQLLSKVENMGKFVNGSAAPNFELVDQNGNKVRLEDFKGKNIYIDFWATWCKPCVSEIPDLKKVEEKFKDKNIVFLSISLDSQKDIEKWKSFIVKKELGANQLIVENAWQSQVVKEYLVESIPRFILIDTEGNLVDINAPRPSSGKTNRIINRLNNL